METERQKIRREEYENRKKICEAMRGAIDIGARATNTDPAKNLEYVKEDFKKVLLEMELPFTLITIRAMIEGASYIRTTQKMGNIIFDPSLSFGLLILFEEELMRERDEKLKALNEKKP